MTKSSSRLLTFLIYLALFVSLIYPYADYDWGWHFRYGEYFIKTGKILTDNLYSWTLANYKWVNHSWLYDIILYLTYQKISFLGLSLTGAVVGFTTFWIATAFFKIPPWLLAILSLFFIQLSEVTFEEGLRSQSLGILLITILVTLLIKSTKKPRLPFFLPPFFLLWANLHGTFTLGILIFIIFFITNPKTLIFPLLLSFLATLINPFGFWSYLEGFKHLINPWLPNILEWSPSYDSCRSCNFPFLLISFPFFLMLFLKRKRLADLPYIIIMSFLGFQAIIHRRYLSIFAAAGLPIISAMISGWQVKINKTITILSITLTGILFFNKILYQIPKYNLLHYTFNDYCRYSSGCSTKLIEYLKLNPPQGKGFNFYDWGGVFIGMDIKTKLFIDGRMTVWKENGYSPFADYLKIYYAQDIFLFNQYHFDWAIVRNDSYLSRDLLLPDVVTGTWQRVFFDKDASYFIRAKI